MLCPIHVSSFRPGGYGTDRLTAARRHRNCHLVAVPSFSLAMASAEAKAQKRQKMRALARFAVSAVWPLRGYRPRVTPDVDVDGQRRRVTERFSGRSRSNPQAR